MKETQKFSFKKLRSEMSKKVNGCRGKQRKFLNFIFKLVKIDESKDFPGSASLPLVDLVAVAAHSAVDLSPHP